MSDLLIKRAKNGYLAIPAGWPDLAMGYVLRDLSELSAVATEHFSNPPSATVPVLRDELVSARDELIGPEHAADE